MQERNWIIIFFISKNVSNVLPSIGGSQVHRRTLGGRSGIPVAFSHFQIILCGSLEKAEINIFRVAGGILQFRNSITIQGFISFYMYNATIPCSSNNWSKAKNDETSIAWTIYKRFEILFQGGKC